MHATTNRYDELSPREQLEIDELINTIAAHSGIDHPTMRRARTSVQRAKREFQTACYRDAQELTEAQSNDLVAYLTHSYQRPPTR